MPNVIRNDIKTRFNDYKKSFNFWLTRKCVNKIILIERYLDGWRTL